MASHHIAHIKGTSQGGYLCVISGSEFAFSDELVAVIGGFYGSEVAHSAVFHVDGKTVPKTTILDLLQNKTVTITYHDKNPANERMGSFAVPKLEYETPSHHKK